LKWQIDTHHDQTLLRDYLRNVCGFSKRTLAQVKYHGGKILVNNEPKTVRYVVAKGDIIQVIFPPEIRSAYMKPEPIPLSIVYEDDDVLVINKQPHIATIPSIHHPNHTIANGVLHHYDQQKLPYTVHVVTRLDRDTSGLLLIAKHRYAHAILFHSQQKGEVKRTYNAVVEGIVKPSSGTIHAPINRDPNSILKRMVAEDGQEAITHYCVLNYWSGHSLVELNLETGRTHQIRVHLSDKGYPLAGDTLYGGKKQVINRQALHCIKLEFVHPITNKRMVFTIGLHDDIKQIEQNLKDNG
jgi:23S rRNA pseudouridine1911/1915/1917 synthase